MSTRNQATTVTERSNRALLEELNWADIQSFQAAGRCFIASLAEPVITDPSGRAVWDLGAYPFLAEETAPPSVNPIILGEATMPEKMAAGEVSIDGNPEKLVEFLSLHDNFEFWFNIVTP